MIAPFMRPVFRTEDYDYRSSSEALRFDVADIKRVVVEMDLTPDEAYSDGNVFGVYELVDGGYGYASGWHDSSGWG